MAIPKKKQDQVESIPLTQLYAKQSEHVVIAALLLAPDYYPKVKRLLPEPEVFTHTLHEELYKAMDKLYTEQVPFEVTALCACNPNMIHLTDVASLITSVPDPNFNSLYMRWEVVEYHLKIIRDAYIRRKLVQRFENKDEMSEVMKLMHEWEVAGKDKLFAPKDLAELLLHMMDSPTEGTIFYPWKIFNNVFGGMSKGTITLVCARPGGGKSVFAENVASHASTIQGKRVLFASCEMTAMDIVKRIASRRTGIKIFNRIDPFKEDEMIDIYKASEEVRASNLFIHEIENIMELEAVLRDKNREFDFIVVDYLQRLKPRQKATSLYERTTYASNELADLAKRYNIPVLAASQFNRNAEKNQPTLGDLRDSGAIEQDAFTIFSLWCNSEDKANKDVHPIFIDVLKNRNGVMFWNYGDFKFFLQWNRPLFKLQDPEGI